LAFNKESKFDFLIN